MKRRAATMAASTALIAAMLGGACGERLEEAEIPAAATLRPPVIFISIDTLRSDRLPIYGYQDGETPAIDALRRDGILFRNAYTHVPLTLPAHASMLTGLLPTGHGVRENMGYVLDGPAHPSLPRTLGGLGYRTAAAVSALVLRQSTGLTEGFERYDDALVSARSYSQLSAARRSGHDTLSAIEAWLEEVSGEPFFLFFHLYEPHRPFEAPEPFRSKLDDPYDAEIASADDVIGALLDRLRALGVYDRALVVLTSDHGEGLGEHGDQEHGPFLYREVLQIPLVVKLPNAARAGEEISSPAQLIDLFPTVLDVLAEPVPEGLGGSSLLALETATSRPVYGETYFPRIHFGWSDLTSLIEYPHHLIWGPDPELYDLEADPGETHNLIQEGRGTAFRLRAQLDQLTSSFEPPGEVDAETRRTLAALGYLGSAPSHDGPLADPKSRLHVLQALSEGFRRLRQRDFAAAEIRFQQVLAAEPEVFDAWVYLGHSQLKLQRPTEALESFERALELSGGSSPSVTLAAASALARLGRLEEARDLADATAQDLPGAYDLLVQIALAQGDLDAAERYLERAATLSGSAPGLLVGKAQLHVARGQYEAAIAVTFEAEAALPPKADPESYQGLFGIRGRAYASLGKVEEAEREFLRELELNPDSLETYSELALLYALLGDVQGASTVLGQLVERHQSPAAYAEAAHTLRTLGNPSAADALLADALRRWPDNPLLR